MADGCFPFSAVQALAFLYVKNQDLTGKTPREICDLYLDAAQQVKARIKEHREDD